MYLLHFIMPTKPLLKLANLSQCGKISVFVSMYGEEERCIQGFGALPEGKRPLGRSTPRWKDNIKTDLEEVGWGVWAGVIWLRTGTGGGHL